MQPASVYNLALEKRLHRRVDITLPGRYMLANKQEYRCQTLDVSIGGIALSGFIRGNLGEKVIAYIDEIGRIEGTIVRHLEKGFAIAFTPSPAKRERLVDRLTWLMNKNVVEENDARQFTRHMPNLSETKFVLPDGRTYPCRIIDMSINGASIQIDVIPDIGAEIMLGKMNGRVIRHHDSGIAVEFTDIDDKGTIADHFGNQSSSTVH